MKLNVPDFVTVLVMGIPDQLNVSYLIGSSFAGTVCGRVRTTQDIAIITDLQ